MGKAQLTSFSDSLRNIRQGDEHALNDLLERWRPFLRLQASGLLGMAFSSRADSSDVVQETLNRVSQDFPQFRGQTEREWIGWIRSILRTQAALTRRYHLAERRRVGREIDSMSPDMADDCPAPETNLLAEERATRLAQAIERLPDVMHDVVVRRVFRQQKFEQIARVIDRSPGATRVIWTRAVQKIRDDLRTHNSDGEDE